MLPAFAEIVKAALIPGSLPFLLLGLGVGVVLLYLGKWGARMGRRWLTALALLYMVLALPIVSNTLIGVLEPEYPPVVTRDDARGARVLVVLGNGTITYTVPPHAIHQFMRRTAFAVLEGARIFALIDPAWVIVSGGIVDPDSQRAPESEVIRDEMVKLGVPADRVLLESRSRNTSEQLANVAQLLREQHLEGAVVLVTTPAHARRALTLASGEGLDVVPSMAGALRYDGGVSGWRQWIPSVDAIRGSESAIYELMALPLEWVRD